MRHTISIMVTNEFGVLSRVSGLFSGRGFNIESLCVAETLDPNISRMTIVTSGNENVLEQINKQLNKLVNVIKVHDFKGENHIERELALIKVQVTVENRAELLSVVELFRAKVVDVSPRSYTIETTGTGEKINAIIEMLRPLVIKDIARTGCVAVGRSPKAR
ncbi:MAG: acetolactate synthase small subunit [Thermodesulfobacteriota bacterium]